MCHPVCPAAIIFSVQSAFHSWLLFMKYFEAFVLCANGGVKECVRTSDNA